MPFRLVAGITFALVALLLGACGGGAADDDGSRARLRVVHALPDASTLDVAIDGETRWSAIGVQGFGSYQDVDPGNRDIEVFATGTASALLSASFSLDADERHTYIAWGTRAAPSAMLLLDDTSAPDNGRFKLKLAHAASGAGSVDVYVTATGTPIADATPAFAALSSGAIAGFLQIDYGTVRIRVTPAGSKDLLYDSGSLRLEEGEVWTAVLLQRGSGRLVNLAMLESGDDGETRVVDNLLAQARVVHAAPDGGSMSARVDGVVAVANLPYRAASGYLALDAGERRVSFEEAGVEVALVERTFAAATDTTLVVAGAPGARVAWALDDVNLPPAAGRARLRFVHAAIGSGALDFTIDYARRAEAVAVRTASAYLEVDDGTHAIGVNAAGSTSELASLAGVELDAGRTYTVLVLGDVGTQAVVVLRDD